MKTFYRGGTGIVIHTGNGHRFNQGRGQWPAAAGRIRFRMCPTWEMTAKLDWEAEDGRGGHGIALYVEEDLDWKALAERRSDHKDEKAAGKASGLDAEARRLETEVIKDPSVSVRQLETLSEATGKKIGRRRVPDLLKRLKWAQVDGMWQRSDTEGGTPALPM